MLKQYDIHVNVSNAFLHLVPMKFHFVRINAIKEDIFIAERVERVKIEINPTKDSNPLKKLFPLTLHKTYTSYTHTYDKLRDKYPSVMHL